jgi:hypothetical protein
MGEIMYRNAYLAILILALLSLSAIGCGDGRTAKKRFDIGGDRQAAKFDGRAGKIGTAATLDDSDGGEGFGGELAELRKKELEQAKIVGEMREALAQGEDVVLREEGKLREIRNRLASYSARTDDYGARPVRYNPDARPAADYEKQREYFQPGRDMPSRPNGSQIERRDGGEREIVLYRGGGENRAEYAPGNNAPARDSREYHENRPLADGNYRQPEYPANPGSRNIEDEEDLWNPPGSLYYGGGEAIPVPRIRNAPPAAQSAAKPAERQSIPQAKAAIRSPIQAQPREAEGVAEFDPDAPFVPDLFLPGGR